MATLESKEVIYLGGKSGYNQKSLPLKTPISRLKDYKIGHDEEVKLLEKKETLLFSIQGPGANLTPGILSDSSGKKYALLPDSLMNLEDNIVKAMFFDLCLQFKLPIKVIPYAVEVNHNLVERTVLGFWMGFFTNDTLKRNRSKVSYELARTEILSLRVKHYFETHPKLGLSALVKDQFFFGNNPEEGKNVKVSFDVKTRWMSLFTTGQNGMYSLLNSFVGEVSLSTANDEELNSLIEYNILPFDVICARHHKATYSQKGNKMVFSGTRKPVVPTQSPLYMDFEMDILSKIISIIFSQDEILPENYLENIYTFGYKSVARTLTQVYNSRWETLARFASRTTNRLQMIRKIIGDDQLKKAKVQKMHVSAFLNDLKNPADELWRDVQHIIGNNSLQTIIAEYLGAQEKNKFLQEAFLNLLNDIYISNVKIESMAQKFSIDEKQITLDYTKRRSYMKKCIQIYAILNHGKAVINCTSRSAESLNTPKVIGQCLSLKKLEDAAISRYNEAKKLSENFDMKVTLGQFYQLDEVKKHLDDFLSLKNIATNNVYKVHQPSPGTNRAIWDDYLKSLK